VLRLIVSEGVAIGLIGIVLGLIGAFALTGLMSAMLVGVSPRDPITFGAGALVLLLMAVVASFVPALRAARVEPVAALRAE
jgi:putative ABC transport system permease protein